MTDPKEKPKTASLFSTMSPETRHPRGREAPALAAARRGRTPRGWVDPRPERPLRALPHVGQGDPFARGREPDLHRRPRRRAGAPGPAQAARTPRPPRSRSRNSARTRSPSGTSSCAAGASASYVTDGETNATLRLGDTPETITLDRACELLAERRNAEPSTARRTTKKAPAKAAKKTAKKAAKKTTKKAAKKTTKKATGAAKRAAVAQGAEVERRADRRASAHGDDVSAAGRLSRLRGNRRQRQEHPGATRRRTARRALHVRARRHAARASTCAAGSSTRRRR